QPINDSNPGQTYINNSILVYADGFKLCAYQLDNGTQKWCSSGNDAALTDSTLYSITTDETAVSQQTTLTAHQASDGKVLWSKQYPELKGEIMFVATSDVLVTNLAESVYAFKATDGHELWHAALSDVHYITVGQ
ncbi:MAG: PQQ-binding-like beta-propeller repeat protein, partial [Chloroflexi bacterium]|nr:PQQ-binding-like beta-propeller repeat protein [Chloroflexota bacterium]